MSRPPRGRAGALVVVMLGHGLLFVGWQASLQQPLRSTPPSPRPASAAVVYLSAPVISSAGAAPAAAARQAAAARPEAAVRGAMPKTAQRTRAPQEPGSSPPASEEVALQPSMAPPQQTDLPSPAALPASAPASRAPRLLDSEATRQALREMAREPRWQEGAARLADAPPGARQRLQQGLARAARGDCLHGDFAGAGMGVLSAPWLAMALLRDACAR